MDLKTLHPQLSKDEREALAAAAGIAPAYLYQLSIGFKRNPSMRQCAAMVAHDKRLSLKDLAREFGISESSKPAAEAA